MKNFLKKLVQKKTSEQQLKKNKKDSIADLISSVAISIAVCVFITVFIVTPNQVEGISMSPNFETGDIILTNRLSYWLRNTDLKNILNLEYQRGDVIVFQKPGRDDLIKRIIGLPGEKIVIKNGKIFINDRELVENYISESISTTGGNFLSNNTEKIIPKDSYIVMGDNRPDSHDSRSSDIGFVKKEWIKGKVILRYWPLNKISIINGSNFIFK